MSASSSTMSGELPPSSSTIRFRPRPAASPTSLPTRFDPVNEIIRTRGSSTIAMPTSAPPPSTCSTPGGIPASSKSRARITPPLTGVFGSLFRTTALPSTSAGASERIASTIGKFHGVMTPTTPSGVRRAVDVRPGVIDGSTCPIGCEISPAA